MVTTGLLRRVADAVERRDLSLIAPLFASDVSLYGSLSEKPVVGKDVVVSVFQMVATICTDIEYLDELSGPHGTVLFTRGLVGGERYEAFQLLRMNDQGLIFELHDSLRPLSALTAFEHAVTNYLRQTRRPRGASER